MSGVYGRPHSFPIIQPYTLFKCPILLPNGIGAIECTISMYQTRSDSNAKQVPAIGKLVGRSYITMQCGEGGGVQETPQGGVIAPNRSIH